MAKNQPRWATDFVDSWKSFFGLAGAKPEDIHVFDFTSYSGSNTMPTGVGSVSNGTVNYDAFSEDTKKVLGNFQAQYSATIADKEEMLARARALYETSIGQTLVDVFINDAFGAFRNPKDFKVEYEPSQDDLDRLGEEFVKQVQDRIDETMDRLDYKAVIADLAPELLRDGEYALRLKVQENKGIVALEDDIDIMDLLPYYRGSKVIFVLEKSDVNTSFANQQTVLLHKPDDIAFFRLNYFAKQKVKFDGAGLNKESLKTFKKETGLDIPKYVRICRPIYYSSMDAMEKVKLMEDIALAADFADLIKPKVVGLGVPATSKAEENKKAIREYERHLSAGKSTLSSLKDVNLDEIVDACKQVKLLPMYSDGKGAITPIDIGGSTAESGSDIRESIRYQRANIAADNGVPAFYLNATEGAVDKATVLKMYSRYTKRLASVQQSIIETTVDIFYRDLQSVGLDIDPRNISVKLKNLVNGDVLDELDMMVAAVTGLGEMFENAMKLTEAPTLKLKINNEKAKEAWDTYTSAFMNISGLIEIDDNPEEETEDEDDFTDIKEPGFSPSSRKPRLSRGGGASEVPSEEPATETPEPANNTIDQKNQQAYNDFVNSPTADVEGL